MVLAGEQAKISITALKHLFKTMSEYIMVFVHEKNELLLLKNNDRVVPELKSSLVDMRQYVYCLIKWLTVNKE